MLDTNIKVVKIEGDKSAEEALSILAESLIIEGWAKPGLTEAVVTRERSFPTGLHTPTLDVAMPHTDPEWTLVPAIVIGALENPAPFKAMDGSKEVVNARLIFLLAIPEGKKHIRLLQGLTRLFSREDSLIYLYENPRKEIFDQLIAFEINELTG